MCDSFVGAYVYVPTYVCVYIYVYVYIYVCVFDATNDSVSWDVCRVSLILPFFLQFLECSVWSPQSIESFVQKRCLLFLEFASLLKKHIYDVEMPERRVSSASAVASTSSSEVGLYKTFNFSHWCCIQRTFLVLFVVSLSTIPITVMFQDSNAQAYLHGLCNRLNICI